MNSNKKIMLTDPCPHPARNGRHETYFVKGRVFCRACGAKPPCGCGNLLCGGVEDSAEHQCGGPQEACGVPGCMECGLPSAHLHGAGARADNAERREAHLKDQLQKAEAEIEQLRVQLAGCGVAALGGTSPEVVAAKGAYGWSPSYQETLDLRRKYEALLRQVEDAIDSVMLRGGYGEYTRNNNSLLQLVGLLGHDLLSARNALNDYKFVYERIVKERDAAKAALDAELPAAWREDLASLDAIIERISNERDEIKRELERVKAYAEGPTWGTHREIILETYRKGAEAMREAAALQCERDSPTHGGPTTVGAGYGRMIRGLPTPEMP